jgi:UPF0755 protein
MSEVLEAITAGGQVDLRARPELPDQGAKSDVVLRELDRRRTAMSRCAKFDAGADPLPPEYLEVSPDPDMVLRITVAEGVTSWQIVDALKKADFLPGSWRRCRPRDRWPRGL